MVGKDTKKPVSTFTLANIATVFTMHFSFAQWVEFLASVLTIGGVWLNARANVWGWPVGLVSVLMAAVVYWRSHLFAEFGLQLFYAASSVYGWWKWHFETENQSPVVISRLTRKALLTGLFLGLLFSLALAEVLKRYTTADVPYLDSAIAGFSLVAQIWMARKHLENWILWTAINLLSIGVYTYKHLWFFMALYQVLFFLGISGYFQWKKKLEEIPV